MASRVLFLVLTIFCLSSCQQDTNVITPETVEAANKHRLEVIDNDPSMTPEQKQKMKQALRLVPGGPPGSQGPSRGKGRGK